MYEIMAWFVVFYTWHLLGIVVGYHRLLAHRAFRCSKLVEYFFVLPGYLGFESSPIFWATTHRAHHRFTDTMDDPHTPLKGFFQSHSGWFLGKTYPDNMDPNIQSPDLMKDPIYRFLDQGGNWHRGHLLNSFFGFGFRVVLWALFGWKIALASVTAGLLAQQAPLFLNVLCHMPKLGYRTYATEDISVNVWWMALLTFGEGWHNNHHAFPGSARNGFAPHELDIAFLVITLFKKLGLVHHVNESNPQSKKLEALLHSNDVPKDADQELLVPQNSSYV